MYPEYIEGLILRLCKQPRTFEFISMNLDGYDPVELLGTLKVLESKKRISNINGLWCIKNKKGKEKILIKDIDSTKTNFFNEHIGFFGLFDKPHPLDFEWRNTTGSLDYLINTALKLNDINDKILFLGFPTLFATACLKNIPQKVTLIEKNSPVVKSLTKLNTNKDRFQIIEADIFKIDPKTIDKYHSIFMDPPWYSPHFYQFMWLAAQSVEVGGVVAISLPPINTRPDIAQERIEWFSFCQMQGLCLENLYSQRLHYAMPFFEFNAFRAAGIKDVLPFWRKGDLALFRRVPSETTKRPTIDKKLSEWVEREVDTVRIRIKIETTKPSDDELKISNLIKGDILPTISSRDQRRSKANIWTSGNRVFSVNNTEKFIRYLDNLKKRKNSKLGIVEDFLNTITEFEKKEYNNYLDWLYHEMERQIS